MKSIVRAVDSLCVKFSYIAIFATFFLMCMTSVHVILRKFTSLGGINASLELTELSMVLIVFCALAYLQLNDGHVRVNMFADMLPKKAGRVLYFVILLISAVVLFIMFYATVLNISTQFASGAQTQVWKIPIWPFVIITAIGLLLYTVSILFKAFDVLLSGSNDKEEAAGGEIPAQANGGFDV
ncbi:MAG: TRAP transporter small permease [Clostridiales Family XIII bacterium]|jgi:TRAP-type C4-dicarboxylate transport system permease small subunit|nr:TRAP transporter small permease [Clostridiales Family XIII bacterium]